MGVALLSVTPAAGQESLRLAMLGSSLLQGRQKSPRHSAGGYTFYFAPRPAKTTYTVLNKIFTSFQSDQLSM